LSRRFPLAALLALLVLAGCKGIPTDSRYQGYGGRNIGGALTGLPVTPYDPNAR
jgi:hypothetical protein